MFGHKAEKYAGEVTLVGLDGSTVKHPIKQCCHCGVHWISTPGEAKGFCFSCMGDVCCKACSPCLPFEQQIENMEAADRLLLQKLGKG